MPYLPVQVADQFLQHLGGYGHGETTVILDRFYRRSMGLSPEKALILAVIENAVSYLTSHAGPYWELYRDEAEYWILLTDDVGVFSFENCCEALGFNPDWMRRKLKKRFRLKFRGVPRKARPPGRPMETSRFRGGKNGNFTSTQQERR